MSNDVSTDVLVVIPNGRNDLLGFLGLFYNLWYDLWYELWLFIDELIQLRAIEVYFIE
jgi:hypothetical protein